jgi:hypothetical protein
MTSFLHYNFFMPYRRVEWLRKCEALIALVEQEEGARMLHLFYEEQDHELSASMVLIQPLNHATGYRSQVATLLSQQGIASARPRWMGVLSSKFVMERLIVLESLVMRFQYNQSLHYEMRRRLAL